MSGVRVLRVYHSAVVGEYRERERLLRERHGWDVHVVAPAEWPEGGSIVRAERDERVPVHTVSVRGRRHPILFWYSQRALRRVLREVRPQLVDVHEEPYSLAAWSVLRLLDAEVPVCMYSAQNLYKRYPLPFRRLERRALARAAACYPCSEGAAAVLRRKGFAGALHVLPLGVRTDGGRRPSPDGTRRVGFVGRLVPEKGADLALRAFAEGARGLDASLEIVGAGPQELALRVLAERLGLGQRVVFRGAVPQAEALERIRSFDVLLVSSRTTPRIQEQFGRAAAQALAAGTPVLATDAGALPELLAGCAELVPEGSGPALAAALRALLRDEERRRELARRGLERAQARLSWERVTEGMDRMYREVLARG